MNVFLRLCGGTFLLWFLCQWGGKLVSFLYACLMRSVCFWNLNPNGLVLFRSCFIFDIGVTLTSCFFPVVSAFNCLFSKFITL